MGGERRLIACKTHLTKSEFKLERGRTNTLRIQIEGDFGWHSVKCDEDFGDGEGGISNWLRQIIDSWRRWRWELELERSIERGELEQLEGDESGDITVGRLDGWIRCARLSFAQRSSLGDIRHYSWLKILFVGRRVVRFPKRLNFGYPVGYLLELQGSLNLNQNRNIQSCTVLVKNT